MAVVETVDDDTRPLYEIVAGRIREKPHTNLGTFVASRVAFELALLKIDGDIVVTHPFIADPAWPSDTRRRPSVAYYTAEQFPHGIPPRGDADRSPHLVVEVVEDRPASSVRPTLTDYFRGGSRVAWVVAADERTVDVVWPDGQAQRFRSDGRLPGDPVLPRAQLEVASFFRDLTRSGR